jgi:hypothetical protein
MKDFTSLGESKREWCTNCTLAYYHESYICWFLNCYVDNKLVKRDSYSDKMFQRLIKLKAFW